MNTDDGTTPNKRILVFPIVIFTNNRVLFLLYDQYSTHRGKCFLQYELKYYFQHDDNIVNSIQKSIFINIKVITIQLCRVDNG